MTKAIEVILSIYVSPAILFGVGSWAWFQAKRARKKDKTISALILASGVLSFAIARWVIT